MKNIYVLCGVAGSGKSTWIKDNLPKFEGYSAVISRDQIRFSMVAEDEEYFSKEDEVFEKFISDIRYFIKEEGVDNIIIDATHINKKSRNKVLQPLKRLLNKVKLNAVVVDVPLEVALNQNENRKGTRAYVPRGVIRRMKQQFEMPSVEEGFDEIIVVRR